MSRPSTPLPIRAIRLGSGSSSPEMLSPSAQARQIDAVGMNLVEVLEAQVS